MRNTKINLSSYEGFTYSLEIIHQKQTISDLKVIQDSLVTLFKSPSLTTQYVVRIVLGSAELKTN